MQTINSLNRNLKKNDDIILNFYKLLTNGKILLSGFNKNYCKYINFWLNKEYRKNINFNKVPDFNVFHKFVYEVNRVKIGNQNYSCAKYISNLDNKIYNNIIFLYELYDRYNKIKKPKVTELNNTCSKISVLSKDYRDSIYKYYKEDKDLYNKLEHIKTLFNNITESRDSPCKDRISFIKPLDFDNHLKEEARKKAEEEEQKEAAEQEKRARDEAAARQAKEDKGRVHQNLLQSNDLSLSSSRDNQSQEMRQEYGEFHSTRYPAGSRELDTTPLQSSAQRYVYSGRPVPSTGLLLEEDHTKEDMELQGEVAYEPRGTDRTRSGISGGSSGIPGYIAEVLGSVDPGPVLGVSGGMGALFLLFKEEEEDSVKFLVVLEDFHQISQIFRNMVVAMLDIVQWI
ncbi:hypothetical protein PVIIG_05511 [Plasmodium vivax India VII]|uniref:VIR protein n=1 Tax=Plasmodium vivax India VII TaxID=1077284 RepID=A0A0J9UV86_PLAVI|nr:hypothetical protein PVIIG_05511 [Plasmodium vivax India VII]